ncbi:ABC transporter permease [Geomicrobium sp. JCM 19055]|uniref:ABC transporter permease n=1 Tax=Geomicrobium sp. JCM 19055 TaxID=1460649 RepID=UPI00045ECDFA|nr:ABC transporter permease [Geomicrobium sp. JCM 19055]GAK00474.1 multidrug ABC transporter permease [Geomicrobium sp. JCM 19055]
MKELATIRFIGIRMSRDFITMLLLLVVPIILITVFSIILGEAEGLTGTPIRDETVVLLVLGFQLFGGAITMNYVHQDLFAERKDRLLSLPMNTRLYGFTIMLAGIVYSIVLGVILIAYTALIFDVNWGNFMWALLVITLMSSLSSIICLVFTFSVNNFKIAERLSEVYGVGMILLAGMFFPMPDNALINTFNDYVNPLMLAYSSIDQVRDGGLSDGYVYAVLLSVLIIIAFGLLLLTGRRRMP